jgi:hypothetical protein
MNYLFKAKWSTIAKKKKETKQLQKQKTGERKVYLVSSSAAGSTAAEAFDASFVASSTVKPLAARLAMAPSFVAGV